MRGVLINKFNIAIIMAINAYSSVLVFGNASKIEHSSGASASIAVDISSYDLFLAVATFRVSANRFNSSTDRFDALIIVKVSLINLYAPSRMRAVPPQKGHWVVQFSIIIVPPEPPMILLQPNMALQLSQAAGIVAINKHLRLTVFESIPNKLLISFIFFQRRDVMMTWYK